MGTNAVGKSTLARAIINASGGIECVSNNATYCKNKKTVVIGDYSKGKKIEGVDSFGETKCVAPLIKQIKAEVIVFEGLKCGTFGASIQDALFATNDQLIIFLYAPAKVINQRLIERSGTGIKSVQVLKQQKANLNAALKYKEIGVPVLSYDTSKITTEKVLEEIKNKIKNLGYGL